MRTFKLLAGFEGILQTDGSVEHQMLRRRILVVGAEVAKSHELEGLSCLCILQASLYLTAGEHFQGIGIQTGQEILSGSVGVSILKEIIVLTDLCIPAGGGIHPVNGRALDLPSVGGVTTFGVGVIGCQNLGDIAVFVSDATGALNDISAL